MNVFGKNVFSVTPVGCGRSKERWFGLNMDARVSPEFVENVRRAKETCEQENGPCPENCQIKAFLEVYGSGGAERK